MDITEQEADLLYMSIDTMKAQIALLEKENDSLRNALAESRSSCENRSTFSDPSDSDETIRHGWNGSSGY